MSVLLGTVYAIVLVLTSFMVHGFRDIGVAIFGGLCLFTIGVMISGAHDRPVSSILWSRNMGQAPDDPEEVKERNEVGMIEPMQKVATTDPDTEEIPIVQDEDDDDGG